MSVTTSTIKGIYFAAAWLFFALGLLGAVLPVLPTTPFMLLALWCFSKSSQRFHDWLYQHRLFGPTLQQWQTHHVIPMTAKIMAVTSMLLSFSYLLWVGVLATKWLILIAVVMLIGGAYILTKPSSVNRVKTE